MNIEGLDYNTRREKLLLPEYGREIKKMVDICIGIEDRNKRQACAEAIVATMDRMFAQEGNREARLRKLWDHLALMSDFKLDIDYPVDITQARNITERPQPLGYTKSDPPVRHYGRLLFELLDKLKSMPDGEERQELELHAALQMKQCLSDWGRGSNDDEKVVDDLARYTDGVIQMDVDELRYGTTKAQQGIGGDKRRKRK